jgi:hypothetical protein
VKAIYELKNLGHSKVCCEITVNNADVQERVEAALIREASKHLMSQEVDVSGDFESGHIVVGGLRFVGEYKLKEVVQ